MCAGGGGACCAVAAALAVAALCCAVLSMPPCLLLQPLLPRPPDALITAQWLLWCTDIEKERAEQAKGPEAQQREFEELVSGGALATARSMRRTSVCCKQTGCSGTASMGAGGGGMCGRQTQAAPHMHAVSVHQTARCSAAAMRCAAPRTPQVQIYIERGLSEPLARAVAQELSDKDVIRAHARDELGIDLDQLANPLQVRAWLARHASDDLVACTRMCVHTHMSEQRQQQHTCDAALHVQLAQQAWAC